jgi:hypothetical protein
MLATARSCGLPWSAATRRVARAVQSAVASAAALGGGLGDRFQLVNSS